MVIGANNSVECVKRENGGGMPGICLELAGFLEREK